MNNIHFTFLITRLLRRRRMTNGHTCRHLSKELDFVGDKLQLWVEAEGYHETVPIGKIIETLDVTREELNSYCRQVLGMNFLSWKKRLRIDEARLLLVSRPEMSASAIGKEVGIFDKSDFRRQFRSIVGCSPVEYRERMSEQGNPCE